jgi:hypothetical protein
MPEIKLPPEVVAAFDALEAGQAIDLVNTFVREDGMLCATIKVQGKQKLPTGLPWQPISTAPTDGQPVLLFWPTLSLDPLITVGAYDRVWEPDESRFTGKQLRENPPTHWCPLPPPAITKDEA